MSHPALTPAFCLHPTMAPMKTSNRIRIAALSAAFFLGGLTGAGVGGLGTGVANMGKEKEDRRSAWGSALTGGLAGAALGGVASPPA